MSEEEVNEVIPHEEWVKNFNETISEYGTLRDFPIPCILCAAEDKGANIETIVCSDCQKKCHVCGIQVEENDDDKGEEMPLSILQCTRCKELVSIRQDETLKLIQKHTLVLTATERNYFSIPEINFPNLSKPNTNKRPPKKKRKKKKKSH